MLEASAIRNTFFTVIKLISFINFLMQTAIIDNFPISFTVTALWHHLIDSIKTLFTAFYKFSFDSLLDGLTKREMQKWFKLNLVLNFKEIGQYVFFTINFKFTCFQNFLKD